MAAKTSKAADPKEITLTYDLFEMPTAQHKAGLAGLLLQIELLDRELFEYKCEATQLDIKFTKENIQLLFDAIYDARTVEAKSLTKWKGAELLRTVENADGKPLYVYPVVQPKGAALCHYFADGDGPNSAWITLWRRMLWEIPRARPTTRKPFVERAAGKSCSEGEATWKALVKSHKKRLKNQSHTEDVSSALLLGSQAKNAEQVPFKGLAEENLLLHFWTLTSLIFVPEIVDADGKRRFAGYVLAIPEVSHLTEFLRRYKRLLGTLPPQRRGGKPVQAIVELPEQGAIDFIESLGQISREKAESRLHSVRSIEFHCLAKQGNNVKTQSTGSLQPNDDVLEQYQSVCRSYSHPLFIQARLLALFYERNWYVHFEECFANREADQFLSDGNERSLSNVFVRDAFATFRRIDKDESLLLEAISLMGNDTKEAKGRELASIVHALIRSYLDAAALQKLGIDAKKEDGAAQAKAARETRDYDENKRKVAEDVFLNLRSRRGQDFVDYFVSRIASAAQFLPEVDYNTLSSCLLNQDEEESTEENWRDVKTLAMLAITSNSWTRIRTEEN